MQKIELVKLYVIFFIFTLQSGYYSFSQQTNLLMHNDIQFEYEKQAYKTYDFHSSVKPYLISNFDSCLYAKDSSLFKSNLFTDNLLQIKNEKAHVVVNPIINAMQEFDFNSDMHPHTYALGLTSFGDIGEKFSFCGNFAYVNSVFSSYHKENIDSFGIIPHNGTFVDNIGNSYTHLLYTGYVSYSPSGNFNFQVGKDKHFWGDGYRSLLLSDNSNSFPFFKTTVDVWKIKYIYMLSSLNDVQPSLNSIDLYGKYTASHYLSWNIGKRFNLNLFETVVWGREDSLGHRGIDVNYLNPIVFYRPIDFSIGSPDNVLMGAGFKYRIGENNHIYGQVILDEFKLSEVKARSGWWGNKQGVQLGVKSYDAFINNLFILAEVNFVRPFTYSHLTSLTNYGNYHQPLAHPLGSNFVEGIGILRYDAKKWTYTGKLIAAIYGADTDSSKNTGSDIFKSYRDNRTEYGNTILQGLKTNFLYTEIKLAYMVNANYHLRLEAGIRNRYTSNIVSTTSNTFFFIGLKTNLYNDYKEY